MKKCGKCGFAINDDCNYCPKCGSVINAVNNAYTGAFKTENSKISKFPFVTKLVIGILALLSVSFYRIASLECMLVGLLGGLVSIIMCAWNNKLSGIIPAILFLAAAVLSGRHPLTQMICIIYMGFEIAVAVKNKK